MNILRFRDFAFDMKMEHFIYSIDENLEFDDFKSKVTNFLPNIKTKNQAKEFILNVIGKLILKRTFVFFLIKAILVLNLLTIGEMFNLFKGTPYENVIFGYKEFMKPKEEFISKLFQRESSGRADITKIDKKGKHTYIGGFQFSKKALKDIGMDDITYQQFKKNPNIFPYEKQVEALNKFMKNNEYYLRNYLNYIGQVINGIEITKSGMLAASHLVGQKKVKQFLASKGKIDPMDGNGVKCSTYMKEFSGYDVD